MKLKQFFKSTIKTEYHPREQVPFYKGYWYYNLEKNRNICIVLPLNIPLVIMRNIWWSIKIFGLDSERFYHQQIEIRKNDKK